jgi:hypothetical protein
MPRPLPPLYALPAFKGRLNSIAPHRDSEKPALPDADPMALHSCLSHPSILNNEFTKIRMNLQKFSSAA